MQTTFVLGLATWAVALLIAFLVLAPLPLEPTGAVDRPLAVASD